jgi:SAM-dependent methyltransferase
MSPAVKARQELLKLRWYGVTFVDWLGYLRRRKAFRAAATNTTVHHIDKPIGHRSRHTFQIADERVLSTSQMELRWKIVTSLYPNKLTSLLDIGCCRGWFVVKAAMLPECGAAMGVDVVPEFIDEAKEAKRLLKLDKAQFEYAFLNELERDPQKYRLPYQTLLMINTYHYLYWGSRYCPTHWPDHDYLLRTLASMCTDRMLLMSPFEVSECPSDIAERAREHPDWAEQYTTSGFFDIASRYFDVSLETYLGVRPLYLMKKK